MVSPPIKHGADVNADSQRTRVAVDGSAASFVSLGGFGDVRGTGIATEYLSERSSDPNPGTSGWATHAITPPQDPLSLFAGFQALDPVWEGDFSADLTKGVFRAWSPVTAEDPNVVDVENLYRRSDLRSAGHGAYQLLTRCLPCTVPLFPIIDPLDKPGLAGASADFNHVIFESRYALVPGISPGPRLFEWANGTLRLAGVLPGSACGSPPCPATSSIAGTGAVLNPPRVISSDGSRIIFTDSSTGQLYERINGSTTTQVNASEKSVPDASQAATYQTASVDGTRVFFTSAEQLTDDDQNLAIDLYVWDASGPLGHQLTRVSVEGNPSVPVHNGVAGVIGASADGRYAYFVGSGQLVAGKPMTGAPGIYVWHEGAVPAVSYVGEMTDTVDQAVNLLNSGGLGGLIRSRVTPDGKHMVFVSHSGLGLLSAHGGVDYDQAHGGCNHGGECGEIYVYGADSDSLACASCIPSGAPPTTDADSWARIGTGASVTALHPNHPLTDDGRRVFFTTAEPLVTGDSNGKSDAYEYDTHTHTVSLISSGIDASDSYFMDADPNGNNVFFVTRAQLVGWDTDANYDLYDARVDGGFPEPPPSRPACLGETCQGPLDATPGTPLTGSSTASGDGNVKARVKATPTSKPKAKKCKKGYAKKKVKGKTKCVRKRTAKKSKRATAQRRAR